MPTTGNNAQAAPKTQSYTLQPGDTYFSLASQYGGGGANWGQVLALNPTLNPQTTQPGTQIQIPSNWNVTPSSSSTNGYTPPTPITPVDTSAFNANVPSNPSSALSLISGQIGQLNQANNNITKALTSSQPDIVNAYNTLRNSYQGDISTAEQNTNLQLGQQGQQYQSAVGQVENTAGVLSQQYGSQEAAAEGNAGASAAARGLGGNSPFVQSAKAAAGQPYQYQLTQLNADTQNTLAQLYSQYTGNEINIQTASNSQIQAINDQIAQLAPQETQDLVNTNLQIAQIQSQQEQGVISSELGAYQIDSANALKQQQINATLQAAQIKAGATVQAATLRNQTTADIAAGQIPQYDSSGKLTGYAPTVAAQQEASTSANNVIQSIIKQNTSTTETNQYGGFLNGVVTGKTTTPKINYTQIAQQVQSAYQSLKSSGANSLESDMLQSQWSAYAISAGIDPTTGKPDPNGPSVPVTFNGGTLTIPGSVLGTTPTP